MKILWLILFVRTLAYGQEHARILSQSTLYNIQGSDDAVIEETYRIRINSEKGKRLGTFVDYNDKFRKITEVTMTVFDQSGKKVKTLRRGDGMEIGFNPSYEINDARLLVIQPEYQSYPYTLEIKSIIKLNGYISLPTWVPRDHFNLAVDQSSLTIIRSQSLDPKIREEFITGTSTSKGGTMTTLYEVKDLPSIDEKIRFTDFYDEQPKVMVSPKRFKLSDAEGSLASWSEFGNWFLQLNSSPYVLDPKTIEFIKGLDTSKKEEVIRRLYEYMQDKVRYVSIQLGIGGFKSLPTEDVEKYGYGDCKALSTYMKNMLDYAGIKSNYILARAGKDVPKVLSDFPSNQFNHVYLGIPMAADTIYLECTSQISPSNFTGTFTDDRNVLWIEKDRSNIIRSRVYDQTSNIRRSRVNIKLSTVGDANVIIDAVNQGVFFDEIMIYKSAPADYVDNYNLEKFNYGDFAVKNFNYKQPERNSPSFNSTFVLQVNGLAKPAGTKLVIPAVPTTPMKKFIDGDDMMKFYSIKRGMSVIDEIEVTLPQDYWIYSLPEPETISTKFGSYNLVSEFDGTKLKIKRSMVLYKGDYTKKSYEEFKAFYQQMERLESRKLVLNSKT